MEINPHTVIKSIGKANVAYALKAGNTAAITSQSTNYFIF